MPINDRQLDFEDFSSDTEKTSALLKRSEVASAKHKLCYEYYRSRKFAILTPSIIMATFTGILGFVITTDAIKRHMKITGSSIQVEDVLTLVIGFLGFIIGLNMIIMNIYDFGSKESMHLSALIEMDNLSDKVRYWKMDRKVGTTQDHRAKNGQEDVSVTQGKTATATTTTPVTAAAKKNEERKALGVVEDPSTHKMNLVVASGKALSKVENEIISKTVLAKKTEDKRSDVSRFSGFNGAYHQINRSCKSTIPTKLSRPFDLFESRLECMSLGHLGIIWDTRMRRNQIMRLAAIEIYNEITGYWAWPFGTPDIDNVIDKSMKRVARLISKDYCAPVKVECCGFTIFRCCCRAKTSRFNVLNNIWEGMEDRERDMMDERGVANFLETGEHGDAVSRVGGRSRTGFSRADNMLEDDAYDAEHRLNRIEDESYYTQEDSRYSRGSYSRGGYSQGGYSRGGGYSREGYSRGGYSQDQYTEEGESYARGSEASSRLKLQNGGDYRGGAEYSIADGSLSEASASQYG